MPPGTITICHMTLRIAVYSDDSATRSAIKSALGSKIASDLPEIEVLEFATGPALRLYMDQPGSDGKLRAELLILDGEATPEGGLGMARQFKDELFQCPPILVVIARPTDAWLAAWSRAEGSVMHPIDPFTIAKTAADLIRARALATA
jgi:hypothetical protein